MKVVFLQDVVGTARVGEVKEVANGFGRNYLLPRRLAVLATPTSMKQAEGIIRKEKERQVQVTAELTDLAKRITGATLTFKEKVVSEDRLYGSVRAAQIAEELSKAVGVEVDKSTVLLVEPIHRLGSHDVTVRLAHEIEAGIKVIVEAQEPEEAPQAEAAQKEDGEQREASASQ